MNTDVEKQFMENGLVNWLYALKKILIYKVYNPITMSDIIDLFNESISSRFGSDLILFNYNDTEKSISIQIVNKEQFDFTNDLDFIIADCMMKFCTVHRSEIETYLRMSDGFEAMNIFKDVIDNNRLALIRQIVMVQSFPITTPAGAGNMYTFRFY